ncbi:universal stress protein [Tropicimonas aquimaris]|uniref:Universal stress protein n=1 Tax=Tropicimonas aquimaris TaxID=914152 RepID=A0ABW3IIY4_9RHOB
MYHNILVPIAFDGDSKPNAALSVAKTLAAKDATVTLLHVIEHVPAYAIHYIPEDLMRATRDGIHAELSRLGEDLPNGNALLLEGHAGRSILDQASRMKADCIVIQSHRPGLQDYVLGSTAAHVVRHANCAVMVVR